MKDKDTVVDNTIRASGSSYLSVNAITKIFNFIRLEQLSFQQYQVGRLIIYI